MAQVLVISPHMDDEVLGCGGTIARHGDEGDLVEVCVVCNRAYGHAYDPKDIEQEKKNAQQARQILGYSHLRFFDLPDERLDNRFTDLVAALEACIAEIKPEIVYVCHAGDLHQDHRAVAHASNIALRASQQPFLRRVLAYEVPSGTDQVYPNGALAFLPTVFMDIGRQLDRKCAALAAYTRESRPFPHPRSPEALRALAQVRGTQCGRTAAEAFVLLREMR